MNSRVESWYGRDPGNIAARGSVPEVTTALGMTVSCLVLAGWALDIATLKNVLPGQPQMVPNTALGFILSSASLWLLRAEPVAARSRRAARACAGVVALMSLLTLAEYLSGRDLRIDRLLFNDSLRGGASFPGRPSPHTALGFLLAGSALLFLSARGRRAHHFAQTLAAAALLVALLALVGYFYEVTFLYGITAYTGMALHTALPFVLLSLGILFART